MKCWLLPLFPQELESYKTKVADETGENELEWEVDDAGEILIRMIIKCKRIWYVWRWANGNSLVFSSYRILGILYFSFMISFYNIMKVLLVYLQSTLLILDSEIKNNWQKWLY